LGGKDVFQHIRQNNKSKPSFEVNIVRVCYIANRACNPLPSDCLCCGLALIEACQVLESMPPTQNEEVPWATTNVQDAGLFPPPQELQEFKVPWFW